MHQMGRCFWEGTAERGVKQTLQRCGCLISCWGISLTSRRLGINTVHDARRAPRSRLCGVHCTLLLLIYAVYTAGLLGDVQERPALRQVPTHTANL